MSKRLILQLLIDENGIYLSRGFKLQRFCGIDEVNKLLKLDVMANACDVSFVEIDTNRGHDSFLVKVPRFYNILHGFLSGAKV